MITAVDKKRVRDKVDFGRAALLIRKVLGVTLSSRPTVSYAETFFSLFLNQLSAVLGYNNIAYIICFGDNITL